MGDKGGKKDKNKRQKQKKSKQRQKEKKKKDKQDEQKESAPWEDSGFKHSQIPIPDRGQKIRPVESRILIIIMFLKFCFSIFSNSKFDNFQCIDTLLKSI